MDTIQVLHLTNGLIGAVGQVIPIPLDRGNPQRISIPIRQAELGVLVTFMGDIKGQVLYTMSEGFAKEIGLHMFGTHLDGDMLESFVGELGNMLSGNWATQIVHSSSIEIAPPVVLQGTIRLHTSGVAFLIPFVKTVAPVEEFNVHLLLEQ